MIVEVRWDNEERKIDLPEGSVVETILSSLGLPPDAFIATKNGVPIPLTEVLEETDTVKLIRVASGG